MPTSRVGVSVVVVVFNIPREAPRTLLSLSAAYQRGIRAAEYEVIVVDNGSTPAVASAEVESFGANFRLIRMQPGSPSPAAAINRGIAEARGRLIGVVIDGARIATPGLLRFAMHGARVSKRAVVGAVGWYLGFDLQRRQVDLPGAVQTREDALLESIGWPADGYRLFEISTMDEPSREGWFDQLAESNALFMHRDTWMRLGGYDERFDLPGGGLACADVYSRAMELPDVQPVVLLGEGVFHQFHGGIATNAAGNVHRARVTQWTEQYTAIRGKAYRHPQGPPPVYVGAVPRPMLRHFTWAAIRALHHERSALQPTLDRQLWGPAAPAPASPAVVPLLELARTELRAGRVDAGVAVARVIRQREPDEPECLRILSLAGGADNGHAPSAHYFAAVGEAYHIAGDDRAESQYLAALKRQPMLVRARSGLARLRLPGDDCYQWLERLHREIRPAIYLETGVTDSAAIGFALPPTLAIGVGLEPTVMLRARTETHIFPEPTESFFARRGPDRLMAGRRLGLGLIGGVHLFEQALRDFIRLESYCDRGSLILVVNTIPLDEAAQRRERTAAMSFHTGDIWKLVLLLGDLRPDLEIFTIAAPPSGLTVIAGFGDRREDFADRAGEAVARYAGLPYSSIEGSRRTAALNVVGNDWPLVAGRLAALGIIAESGDERDAAPQRVAEESFRG
jgi:hypothetical protein